MERKRFAAVLLCLLMTLSLLPMVSHAENGAEPQADTYTVTFQRNDGTDTVYHTVTAEADAQITFPADPSRNGFVFKGWYAAPSGGDPVDSATFKVTGDVTLYAGWMDNRLNYEIGIGINLLYHSEGYQYHYAKTGVYENSYQTYPNEPITIWHATLRTWKKNGTWEILSEDREHLYQELNGDYYRARLGAAGDFVSWDFFTSPDAVNNTDNTIGIADPTGAKVRAMLNLTDEDYDAIAAAWIAWAQDHTNKFSKPDPALHPDLTINDGDRYYDGWSHYAKSQIDWCTVNAADYKAVPYVVKYQTGDSNVWFIDMLICPKNKYTLGYDGNLQHGYTTDKAFPASSTHNEGTIANVVLDPNISPTKTVNGQTLTAKFLYWVDEYGNRYGKGYTTSIPMWSDKILYAIWEYPDTGSLRITKKVTNVDSGNPSPKDTAFTFQVALKDKEGQPLTGRFPYTIYNTQAQQQSAGYYDGAALLANGTAFTFTLQEGWEIYFEQLPHDTICTISESSLSGYTPMGLPREVTIVSGNKIPVTAENLYAPEGYYIVEHYFEEAAGQFPVSPNIRETFSGTDGTPQPRSVEHYTYDPSRTVADTVNGIHVHRLYYVRTRYPHKVRYLEEGTGKVLREEELRPGDILGVTVYETPPEIEGYNPVSTDGKSIVIQEETDTDGDGTVEIGEIRNNIITFYYKRKPALTIRQNNDSDAEQVFVYKVENTEGLTIYVTVVGKGETTIHDLPHGTYTVTQVNDWSWRHDDGPNKVVINTDGITYTTMFENNQKDNQWLDGNSPQIDNRKKGS